MRANIRGLDVEFSVEEFAEMLRLSEASRSDNGASKQKVVKKAVVEKRTRKSHKYTRYSQQELDMLTNEITNARMTGRAIRWGLIRSKMPGHSKMSIKTQAYRMKLIPFK